MNAWIFILLIGLVIIIVLTWILIQTPWMKGVHDNGGTAFVLGCPMGLGFNYDDVVIPLDQQIVTPAIIKKRRQENNSNPQRIPRTIYQTHERNQIPLNMRDNIEDILLMNPDYDYYYYDNARCRKFLSKHFEPRVINCYNKLIPGAYKADLFRYCVLYIKGGVYLDTGFVPLVPLSKFLNPSDTFVSARDGPSDGIYNAFIACTPKHPILERTIELVLTRIEQEDYGPNCLYPTGPFALRDGFKEYFEYNVVIEEKDYGRGIRLLHHQPNPICVSNPINCNGQPVFYTKYPSYRSDMRWYSRVPNYTPLYHKKLIYSSTYQPEIPRGHLFKENCPGFIGPIYDKSISIPLDERECSPVTKYRPAISRPCREQRIPRIIHQTNERDEIPVGMKAAMQTIHEKNPNYEYLYYNSRDRRDFIRGHFDKKTLECYDAVDAISQRNLFIYCLLYIRGGIYLDSNLVANDSLDYVIGSSDTFITSKEGHYLSTSFICATPYHPIIFEAFNLMIDRIITGVDYCHELDFNESFTSVAGKPLDHLGRYSREVQILEHQVLTGCMIGSIKLGDRLIFQTKYPNSQLDSTWYNPQSSSGSWRNTV